MKIEKNNQEISRTRIEKTEKEIKENLAKKLGFEKDKKKLLSKIEKDKKLAYLKSLIERGLIKLSTAEHMISGEDLETNELKEVFEKIDEIDEIHDIENILPKKLRITKEDFLKALDDEDFRIIVIKKLDDSLDFLYRTSNPFPSGLFNFFSQLMHSIGNKKKALIKIQENTIDIKSKLMK